LWYDEQRAGLGDEFVSEVTALLERIAVRPLLFPLWPGVNRTLEPVRRALTDRFPYAVAFESHTDHILVLAIAHCKRRPLYWLTRANP
jgi:toxin ParE1/3/4